MRAFFGVLVLYMKVTEALGDAYGAVCDYVFGDGPDACSP